MDDTQVMDPAADGDANGDEGDKAEGEEKKEEGSEE